MGRIEGERLGKQRTLVVAEDPLWGQFPWGGRTQGEGGREDSGGVGKPGGGGTFLGGSRGQRCLVFESDSWEVLLHKLTKLAQRVPYNSLGEVFT